MKSINKMEDNFIYYPPIFVIDVATCYAEKLLGLQYESVNVNCKPRLWDLTWTEFYVRKFHVSTRFKMRPLKATVQRELARMNLKTIKEPNLYFGILYFISGNLEFIQRALRSSRTKMKNLIRHEVKQLTRAMLSTGED